MAKKSPLRTIEQKWHHGCSNDSYRNDFVIPVLLAQLEKHNPSTIGYFGSATGYIPSTVGKKYTSRDKFVLFEINNERLEFSKKLSYGNNDTTFISDNILVDDHPLLELDFLVVANTLLDLEFGNRECLRLARQLCKPSTVLVFLPDVLQDVFDVVLKNDVAALDNYLNGKLNLPKNDKFTGTPYPFIAHRPINLISTFLESGFILRNTYRYDQNSDKPAYCLEFGYV